MYYRVALQTGDLPPWQWRSTPLTSLQGLFGVLRRYNALPNERIRVFFASSKQGLEQMLTCQNQGVESNSITLQQLIEQKWRINPSDIRRVEAELGLQENQGSISPTVLPEQPINGKPMQVPEMTPVQIDQGIGADYDLPYLFTLPTFLPEALRWARLLARVQAGELVTGERELQEELVHLSDVLKT